jgi:lipopolysaccharide export system permease protein
MNLLDRYIIRQYLTNIAALVLIFGFFVVAIDASLQLNQYWETAGRLAGDDDAPGPLLLQLAWMPFLVFDIWWPRLLGLFNFLLGLILVAAMGFTCAQLMRHRELVAVLTSGQSLFRIARPILVVAVGITFLQALNQEFVMPRIAPLLEREPRDAGRHTLGAARVPLTDDGFGRLFYADSFDAQRGTMHNVYIWERDERGLATMRLHATQALWSSGAWELTDASMVILAPGLREPPTVPPERIETDLDPTMLNLKRYARFGRHLSFSQTVEMLRRLDRLGVESEEAAQIRERIQRVALGRISAMMTNLLTLTIAMAFFITREPRNMLYQTFKCAPVVVVSLVGAVLGASIPLPGVPTALSVFLPVMILTPVAIAVITRIRT